MRNKRKIVLFLIIVTLSIFMDVHAVNYDGENLKVGKILYVNDEINTNIDKKYYVDYCKKYDDNNTNNCIFGDYNEKVYSLDDYNTNAKNMLQDYENYIIEQKDSNGKYLIGWKIVKIVPFSDDNNEIDIYTEPYYGVKNEVTKQPSGTDLNFTVSNEENILKYNWYEVEKNNDIGVLYSNIKDKDGNQVSFDKIWKYNENSNTYENAYEGEVESKNEIAIYKDSKLKLYYQSGYININNGSFAYTKTNIIEILIYKSNDIIYSFQSNSDLDKIQCDENTKYCSITLDLSDIPEGVYTFILHNAIYTENALPTKVEPANLSLYTKKNILLENENKKTLSNPIEGKTYFSVIEYNDGSTIQTNEFIYPKTPGKIIDKKITDIVANPLTGDNIIYTMAICLITLSSIVILTVTLKKILYSERGQK